MRIAARAQWRTLVVGFVLIGLALPVWAQTPGIDGPPMCPVAHTVAPTGTATRTNPTPAERTRPGVAAARAAGEAAAADPGVLVAAEPMENFGVARYRLEAYGDCVGKEGCYWRDLDAQYRRAETALQLLANQPAQQKLALVLDIDETTLSSYCEMKREDFGYIGAMFNSWVLTPQAAVAIPGALRLFRQARAEGLAVFFLTGRPEAQRTSTERNLRTAGFEGWQGLVLRNAAEKDMLAGEYKSFERAKMTAAGYRLVMSVGDQWSDLSGDPKAELSVKLPNPFYFLP